MSIQYALSFYIFLCFEITNFTTSSLRIGMIESDQTLIKLCNSAMEDAKKMGVCVDDDIQFVSSLYCFKFLLHIHLYLTML